MRVLHVSPSFYPTKAYGGTISSGYGLCRGLTELGCEVRVLTTDTDGPGHTLAIPNDHDVQVDGMPVRYCHKQLRDSVSFALLRVLPEYVRWADVVHLTAVYSFPTFPTLFHCRRFNKPVVWSPRGALQRWDESTRRIAKFVWEIGCRCLAQKDRLVLHTTSQAEAEQSRKRFPGVRTVVIRSGVELPQEIRKSESNGELRLTYLGRMHPIKGIEFLLEACSLLEKQSIPWHLNLAGRGSKAYVNSLKARVGELGLYAHVEFLGEVFDERKSRLLADSDVVIVPSHVENFAMVIAEALAHEVPVIASRGTPWEGLETNSCGLWVNNDPQSLAFAIRSIRTMPLGEMGRRGRCWMEREFSWHSVSDETLSVYRELAGQRAN